jgi:hypothetical protein
VGKAAGEVVGNSIVGLKDLMVGVVVGIDVLGDSVGELTGVFEGDDVTGASIVGELTGNLDGADVTGCSVG